MLTFNAATIYQTIISSIFLKRATSLLSIPTPHPDEYQYRFLHFIAFNMYTI